MHLDNSIQMRLCLISSLDFPLFFFFLQPYLEKDSYKLPSLSTPQGSQESSKLILA